jgi:hypothetical protein
MVQQQRNGVFYVVRVEILLTVRFGATSLLQDCVVESWALKRRLGGWCGMAASLGASGVFIIFIS